MDAFVEAAADVLTFKNSAKPNSNSTDKNNFRLILSPPYLKHQFGFELTFNRLNNSHINITYKGFDLIFKKRQSHGYFINLRHTMNLLK